jgi:hypothetical protein
LISLGKEDQILNKKQFYFAAIGIELRFNMLLRKLASSFVKSEAGFRYENNLFLNVNYRLTDHISF